MTNDIQLTDGCSFNKCATQYKLLIDTYKNKLHKINKFLEDNAEKYNQYKRIIKQIEFYSPRYDSRYILAKRLNLSNEEFNISNLPNVLNKLREIKVEISNYLNEQIQLDSKEKYINSKVEYLNKLRKDLDNFKVIDVTEPSFKQEDIINVSNELNNKDTEINNARLNIDKIDKEMQYLAEYSKLDAMNNYIKEYDNKVNELNSKNNEYTLLSNNINTLNNTISTIESLIQNKLENINSYHNSINDLNEKITIIKNEISQKNKLDSEIDQRSMIAAALHPTKGIPSYLVKGYLNKIEEIANEILTKSFDSTYRIFLENLEKDFFIRVFEKSTNRFIPDVKLCSSGQQAIIKLVLSIALNKCAVKDAVYLRLDECDSVLSKDNLAMVEILLNSLLSKFNIDQVFIVTHNSAISVADMTIEYDRENMDYTIKRIKDGK